MADSKKTPVPTPSALETATEQGYFGEKNRPAGLENEAYALPSGPDSPTPTEELDAIKSGS